MSSPQPVDAAALARRMGHPEPDAQLLEAIGEALADAEADVEGYLNRPIRPVTKVARGCWPVFGGWDIPIEHGSIREIVSAVPEVFPGSGVETGTFTVTYTTGLDYLNDPELRPIRRYVTAAAVNDPMLARHLAAAVGMRGPVKSVSVSTEGQSKNVTYGDLSYGGGGAAGADAPGALPSKKSLDRWRLRAVHQAPDQGRDARIHGGVWRDRDGFWNRA